MKYAVAAAAVIVAAAQAQDISSIPSCALNCLVTGVTGVGCSSVTDFECACGKSSQLQSQVTPCVQNACSAEDQQATAEALEGICADAGVPITITATPEGGASSSAAPSSSEAAEPSATEASETASATPAESSSEAAGGYGSSTPVVTPTPSLSTPLPGPSGTIITHPLTTNGSYTTPGTPAFTGAANANGVSFGAAGLLAALAYAL